MRGPEPPTIELDDVKREALDELIRRHSTAQQIALRACVVLAAAAGQNNTQIARQLGVGIDMVRLWRARWLSLRPVSREDLPRQTTDGLTMVSFEPRCTSWPLRIPHRPHSRSL
jgi:hypothetical protein